MPIVRSNVRYPDARLGHLSSPERQDLRRLTRRWLKALMRLELREELSQ